MFKSNQKNIECLSTHIRTGAFLSVLVLFLALISCKSKGIEPAGTGYHEESGMAKISEQTAYESEEITEGFSGAETETEIEPAPEPEILPASEAEKLLLSMSAEEKIAQMFLVRCPVSGAEETALRYRFGGYILFAVNFDGETPESIKSKIEKIQSASKIPMLIGVDEEGGTVTRVSRFPAFRDEPFKSPRTLFAAGGYQLIKSDTEEKAKLLLSLGINLNLAPVCDLSQNQSDFIYYRSFGGDAELAAEYVRDVVGVMSEYKLGSSLKHFPGYGANADTHTGIVRDGREYSAFEAYDFLPFIAGIEAGAGSVMVSHNIMECVDPDRPASISQAVHDILRNNLNFDGVIITDDLAMSGVADFTDGENAAVSAVLAGNDMLCCSDYETQYAAVLSAYNNGIITADRIDSSVRRILTWKLALS